MFMLKNLLSSSIIRFGITGIANTLFGLLMIYLGKLLGAGDITANIFGYSCGLLLSFQLNSSWTFRYQGRLLPVVYKFCMVILIAYLVNLSIVLYSINELLINSYFAQALGVLPYAIISYLGLRFYVFTKESSKAS
ncbi:MAG: GtrA family protein [Xanthomonadales bacterium]|nr:GtrA family protein [Xanthomonadales bacterium]